MSLTRSDDWFTSIEVTSHSQCVPGKKMSKIMTNVYILAPENEFSEIIYAFFAGRQNIFSTIFGN